MGVPELLGLGRIEGVTAMPGGDQLWPGAVDSKENAVPVDASVGAGPPCEQGPAELNGSGLGLVAALPHGAVVVAVVMEPQRWARLLLVQLLAGQ